MISKPDLSYEKQLWSAYNLIAGLDEAGRGALAGPVFVGAVILPKEKSIIKKLNGVHDSKLLNPKKRNLLSPQIKEYALAWGIGFSTAAEIDRLGIVPATRLAASRAIEAMCFIPEFLLTDFRLELPEFDIPQTAIVKGDQKSLSIASASILAKTARDEMMCEIDLQYPAYHFSNHKGYGTLTHRKTIKQFGHSPIHRKTFKLKK
ncbi:MAG: ribonuclease HII [Anaerolineales bacterium]|nr:ribonuclease HII [Anaerolineales bacterium]MBX3035731.1 ribonuclease HII [Anaerolineales bacterium]